MSKEAARLIASLMIKAANNEDIAGSMAKLEALRQNAVLRHGIRSEGMLAGGRAAGGTAGAGAGAVGGLAGLLKAFGRGMGIRGKLGLAAGGALGGGVVGELGGAAAGGSLAKMHVPKLPDHMQTAVTPDTAAAVSSTLAKAAADGAGIISRMTKTANAEKTANMFLRWLGGTIGRPFTQRMPGAGLMGARKFAPGRTAAVLGGGGVATLGGGHMYNAAQNQTGRDWYNPFTWGSRPSEEDIFKRNSEEYDRASAELRGEMDTALAAGDMSKYNGLNERMQRGDFQESTGWNPLNWRFGGLNPFSSATPGATLQQRMLDQQKALQGKYNAEMGKSGPQAGDAELVKALQERMASPDLLPQQAAAMQKQLDAVRARMKQAPGVQNDAATQIRQRMESAGMRFTPFGGARPAAAPAAPGPQPYTGWNLGGRPRMPGYMTGAAMMPGDFRPYQQPWDFVQQSGSSPFMQG
jgi:hypothetical protein